MTEPRPVTYLFSDIEGSTRLWETDPEGAARALARHDRLSREVVQRHHGTLVKMTGDGLHAAFDQPDAAIAAVIELQKSIAVAENGIPALKIRCGLHLGADQRRDNDFYGPAVNRAARIMSAAHGDQVLLSQAVVERAAGRFPDGAAVRELGHVRLKDLASPERIYQLVHPSLRAEFPALRSLASTPNNLPQQLNSFVGREREMGEVRRLLSQGRLVTLLAMGGIGKSRLSIQLGAEVLEDYPDGVWLVELAPLSDPAAVAQAVATVLGVREEPGGTVTDALLRFVRERQLLLLLDNCEHLVQACAELAKALLQASPGLRILATSRDALRIAGETSYQLQTLSVPSATTSSPDALMQHEAVCLFVDRAMSSQPAFVLNERNSAAVAEICHRLDGIPLALELAAARVRTMSVGAIAERLKDRFKLLVTGDRTVLPRQKTLRALIDWSYELLTDRERAVFARLGVFAGGWTLDGAERVASGDGVDCSELLDELSQLVEKSLVILEPDGTRYRMLETVREYAVERLSKSADEARTRDRHLGYFLDYLDQALPHIVGPDQGLWMSRLDLERENFVAAHHWCDHSPQGAEAGVRLVSALKYYWLNRGLLSYGYEVACAAISRPAAKNSLETYGRGVVDAGTLATFMGRYAEARRHLEEGLQIARQQHNDWRQVAVLQYLGEVELALGNPDKALGHCEEAESIARRSEDKRLLAAAFNGRGQLLRVLGSVDQADSLYRQALQLSRELGDDENIAGILLNLAMVGVMKGRVREACSSLQEVLSIQSRIGSQAAGQSLLEVCAGLAAETGDLAVGAELLGAAEEQANRSSLRRDPADQAFITTVTERIRAELGAAAATHEATGKERPYAETVLLAGRLIEAVARSE